MTKQRAITVTGTAVALILLVWVFAGRSQERRPACAQAFLYDVVSRSRGGNAPALAASQIVRAKLSWEPVAGNGAAALFKVRPSQVVLEGFPEAMKPLAAEIAGIILHVELSDDKETLLWGAKEKRSAFAMNVAKLLVESLRFQRRDGVAREKDGLGAVTVRYSLRRDLLSREKLRYEKMHHPSPPPDILESSGHYEWQDDFLPRNARSKWRHAQQLEPSGGKVEITGELAATLSGTSPEVSGQCASVTAETYVRSHNLVLVPWAFELGEPAKRPAVSRTSDELLKEFSKSKNSPAGLEDLTARLEQHPEETGRVRKALEKISADEERSAWLISVLANAQTPQAQAALREMIDYYLRGGKTRLAIRVMRAQQLSDYVDAASVENLVRIAESRSESPRVRQAALFAAAGAATVLGDSHLSGTLRRKWEAGASESSGAQEKAEYLSALGNLASEESVPFLTETARKEGGLVGTQAIDALRLVRSPEAQRTLVEIGTGDPSDERRRAALQALEFRPFSEETCARLIPRYQALLQQHGSSRAAERMQILSALGQPGHQNYEAVTQFFSGLQSDGRLTKKELEFLRALETVGFRNSDKGTP